MAPSVDFVPIVRGDGTIRLEVRGSVSELDPARGAELRAPKSLESPSGTSIPPSNCRRGSRWPWRDCCKTAWNRQNKGVPLLADLPVMGRFFSRVEEKANEVELLMIVTPELIGPLDPHQLPECGPGQLTVSPDDKELYCYGYLEVPNCAAMGPLRGRAERLPRRRARQG